MPSVLARTALTLSVHPPQVIPFTLKDACSPATLKPVELMVEMRTSGFTFLASYFTTAWPDFEQIFSTLTPSILASLVSTLPSQHCYRLPA